MNRKNSLDIDKPLSIEQAQQKLQKGLTDYLAGNDLGPIVFRLKPTKKPGELYPLKLTWHQRDSLVHYRAARFPLDVQLGRLGTRDGHRDRRAFLEVCSTQLLVLLDLSLLGRSPTGTSGGLRLESVISELELIASRLGWTSFTPAHRFGAKEIVGLLKLAVHIPGLGREFPDNRVAGNNAD